MVRGGEQGEDMKILENSAKYHGKLNALLHTVMENSTLDKGKVIKPRAKWGKNSRGSLKVILLFNEVRLGPPAQVWGF